MGIATITSLLSLLIISAGAIGAYVVYKEMKKVCQEQRKIISEYKNLFETNDNKNKPKIYH